MLHHPKDHIIDVLKHELVHYVLCYQKRPFNDGHPVFEGELKKHGITSSGTYEALGDMHRYECKNCNKEFFKRRKISEHAYCNCSKGPNLIYHGIITKTYAAFDAKG
jgi:SprT-like protein